MWVQGTCFSKARYFHSRTSEYMFMCDFNQGLFLGLIFLLIVTTQIPCINDLVKITFDRYFLLLFFLVLKSVWRDWNGKQSTLCPKWTFPRTIKVLLRENAESERIAFVLSLHGNLHARGEIKKFILFALRENYCVSCRTMTLFSEKKSSWFNLMKLLDCGQTTFNSNATFE